MGDRRVNFRGQGFLAWMGQPQSLLGVEESVPRDVFQFGIRRELPAKDAFRAGTHFELSDPGLEQ